MAQPLVSFVMTCFNQRAFLAEAIDSVLSQSYRNIELIVIDDGSCDNSTALVGAYKDQRLSYLWQENTGPSSATNRGIGMARGEFIALMGGDDVCEPTRAEIQLEQISRGHDIVFCIPRLIDSQSHTLGDYRAGFNRAPFKSTDELYCRLFHGGNFLCGPSAFARRGFFERCGRFRLGLIQLQDFDLWIRACRAGADLGLYRERVLNYRLRDDGKNLSHSRNQARTDFEMRVIYAEFFDGAPVELLQKAFSGDIGAFDDDPASVANDLAFLYLSNAIDLVRPLGIEALMKALDDPVRSAELARRGFQPRHLFQMMNNVKPFEFCGSPVRLEGQSA